MSENLVEKYATKTYIDKDYKDIVVSEKSFVNLVQENKKQKEVLDKIKEYIENLLKEEFEVTDTDNINYGQKCQRAYFSDSELGKILELLEEIE